MNKLIKAVLVVLFLITSSVQAAPLSVFSGWTLVASDGRQAFDAEYLFNKLEGTKVDNWNNDSYYGKRASQGVNSGSLVLAHHFLLGKSDNFLSYYNIFSPDRSSSTNLGNMFGFAAHWTMSCGSDEIEGTVTVAVPEPGSLLLLGARLAWIGSRASSFEAISFIFRLFGTK